MQLAELKSYATNDIFKRAISDLWAFTSPKLPIQSIVPTLNVWIILSANSPTLHFHTLLLIVWTHLRAPAHPKYSF